jgi:hypothetical protein
MESKFFIFLLIVVNVALSHASLLRNLPFHRRLMLNESKIFLKDDYFVAQNAQPTIIRSKHHQIVTFLSGGLAGTIASTLTMPLEVVKTQMQASTGDSSKRSLDLFVDLWQKDGTKAFFRGLLPMLVGIIPTRAIYFWAYSGTKELIQKTQIGNSPVNHLLSAFSAGVASNTVSHFFLPSQVLSVNFL